MTSSTSDDSYGECPVCGKKLCAIPSEPLGDATCPHCGSLVWLRGSEVSGDIVRALADRGADVELDAEGQITSIRFSGHIYNDSIIDQLAALGDIETIDLRDTAVTPRGADRLRRLLPNTDINH